MSAAWRRVGATVATFAGGQAGLQLLQLLAGLLIVRSFSIEHYAAWAVLVSTQVTANALADLGARDGVVALSRGGLSPAVSQPALIAEALRLRRRHLILMSPAIGLYFAWLAQTGVLPADELVAAIGLTVAAAYVSAWTPYYSLPLLLHRDMGRLYVPQIVGALARLALIGLAFETGYGSVTTLLLITVITVGATGLFFRRQVAAADAAPADHADTRRSLRRYAYAFAPAAIYMAFQDHIAIFLLSWTGSPAAISQTAAIGRLAMVFQVFLAMNTVLVQPWIAQAAVEAVARRVTTFAVGAIGLGVGLVLLTWWRPDLPLRLLGDAYRHAEHEMLLGVVATATFYAANAFYCANVARGWIWRWTGAAYTVVMGAVQLGAIVLLGVRDAADAFHVMIIMAATGLAFHLVHSLAGLAGLRRGRAVGLGSSGMPV